MEFLKIDGIKCDNCSYEKRFNWGSSAKQMIKTAKFWLNKPCPECGAPLLTEADYKTCVIIIRFMQLIYPLNCISRLFKRVRSYDILMNGTGNITVKEKTNGRKTNQ